MILSRFVALFLSLIQKVSLFQGFPPVQSYVMNLSALAAGEPPIKDFKQYLNFSFIADGLVGGHEPNVIFYFPVLQNVTAPKSRYWTMIAAPVSDMKGGREQSVWFRFQQLECAGPHAAPPCQLHGEPQYGPLDYRTVARTLFPRPYLAHFGSFFRHCFAVLSARNPERGTK